MTTFTLKHFQLIEKLSNASAVSGDESEVRSIILDELKPHLQNYHVDTLGNILLTKPASKKNALKVMLAAHMDEVGFMIANEEGEGIFRFELNGSIDPRQLPGKPVLVGKDLISGVIGLRHVHLTTPQERSNPVSVNNLRIDVGPGSSGIKPGDRAVFATRLTRIGPSLVGKALDDRLGVGVLIELVKNAPPNIELHAAFTVQEETGLRGARVAAFTFKPDIAFVLDTTPAYDLPSHDGEENLIYNTRLGQGPAIYIADRATLSDPRLVRFVRETAEKYKIPYQIRQPGGGGTDAGSIHKQNQGIPTISISTPARYIHTAASISRVKDYTSTIDLLHTCLSSITPDLLAQERN